MINEIIALRNEGYSFRKIAEELGTTVGKVQYRYQKHQDKKADSVKKKEVWMLPNRYEQTQVTLLSQSPLSIYAFWDLSEASKHLIEHQVRQSWEILKKQLRLYDITALEFNGHYANYYADVPLPEMTNNWFFRELKPNRTYCVDIGVISQTGAFLSMARSNAIDTPRFKDSNRGLHEGVVYEWKLGLQQEPAWLEHFSTYSFYEKSK
ncbi:DUF4912 domain-containing protein [Halalkalibacterium ligniniphilum]|uniref:DUF4912 domain-containing protein n=1 Tax=Halalkalibacterium ligniniphilum TaxID=1134413 RepID=UPI0003452002|nr:DUF4912 domain-containing protein [Halalkalibacterium ligniniphilum]